MTDDAMANAIPLFACIPAKSERFASSTLPSRNWKHNP